jgi:hypothetical protein
MALDTLSLGGLVFDNDKMRFTIQARREEALKLIDAGLSHRQAAKVLDVPTSTLQRDLAHFGPESGPERATRAETIRRRNDQKDCGRWGEGDT